MTTTMNLIAACMVGAVATWLVSIFVKRQGKSELADTWRGLAGILLLIAVSIRVYNFSMSPPTAAGVETSPQSVFGDRLVSQKHGLFYDLVLDAAESSWLPYFELVGDDVRKLGTWMSEVPSRAVDGDVAVSFRADLTDKYGKISKNEVLTLRWTKEDWQKMEWKTIEPRQVLALATMPFLHPAMRKHLVTWCVTYPQGRWKYCR